MNTPLNTKATSWLVRKFLGLFEFRDLAIYASDNSHFGFVIVKGNPVLIAQGISAIVKTIATDTGKSEQEIIRLIAKSHPKEI